jgi:1-acyl-sn-glycerol-3-phosphate acyltransferase
MKDSTNRFLMRVLNLFMWRGKLAGQENLPSKGPAVFIANHLETLGPIAAICSIPLRLHVWSNMLDEESVAVSLRWDFTERALHLKPPLSTRMATGISKIIVPLLRSLEYIPIHVGNPRRMADTLRSSVEILQQGKFVLLFPEDRPAPINPVTGLRPFQHIFVRLAEQYYAQTGERLEFTPVTIHAQRRLVVVGQPVAFDPHNPVGLERRRLKDILENLIITTYAQLEGGQAAGRPSPRTIQDPNKEIS